MAITDINSLFSIPPPPDGVDGVPNVSTFITMDVSGEAAGMVFRAPKSGTLDKCEFRLGAVTNTPDNGIRVSFQSLSGSNPDNTQSQFRDVTSGLTAANWIVPGLMTDDGTDGGVKRTVTAGDVMAIVIEYVTFVAGDSFSIQGIATTNAVDDKICGAQFYGAARTSAAVWSRFPDLPSVVLKYDDGSYACIGGSPWYPWINLNSAVFNSGSTPDERGLIFQLPVSMRARAAWFRGVNGNASDLVLYDTDGTTPLATVAVGTSIQGTLGNNFHIPFAPVTLSAGVNYRVVLKPGASNITLYDYDVPNTTVLAAVPGGTAFHYTERTNAGAWTETTTKRPWMGLLFDGVDVSAGGGGVHASAF